MTIVGQDDFVKVSISASLKSFLLIMCIDVLESTTISRSSGLRVDAGWYLFSGGEKNVALWCSFNLNTPASTLLRGHLALATMFLLETDPQILERWSYAGEVFRANISERRFWSRILVWRAIAIVNFTRWIGFRLSVHFRKIDFGEVMSWNTQLNCRALDDRRLDYFCPNVLSLLFPGFPGRSWHPSVTGPLSCQSLSSR